MELLDEFKKRARHVVGPVMGVLAVTYFGYHALHGDRGLFALRRLQHQIAEASQQFAVIDHRRQRLQHRVHLLYPDSLDPDLLAERAQAMLNYGEPGEYVFIDTSTQGTHAAATPPASSSTAPRPSAAPTIPVQKSP